MESVPDKEFKDGDEMAPAIENIPTLEKAVVMSCGVAFARGPERGIRIRSGEFLGAA